MNLQPQIKTLPNKMGLLTLNLPQSQSVTALLMVKVGSRYESDQIAGLSHFLEHMVFKGTKRYPTTLALASSVDSVGAEFNAFTSKEFTGYYVKSDSIHLPLALDVLSQLVFYPTLPEQELSKEKGVIIEEINMYEDHPISKVGEIFESLLYGLTPLGRETIGFKETVGAMKRNDFLAYRHQWYQPQRMILGIVGKQAGNIDKLVLNYHAAASKFNIISKAKEIEKLTFVQQKPGLRVKYKKTEQAHLCLGVRAFPQGHKDRYVLAVLSTILGGNMSSRLFVEVREKRGLAYYIRSNVSTYFDNGYFVTQAGVDLNKAQEAVKVILQEYQKVPRVSLNGSGQARVPQVSRELKKAKEFLKGKLALSLEDSHDIASFFVEDLLMEGRIRTPQEIINGIEKVTINDISRVAKKIFVNEGLNLAIIGPYRDTAAFEKILEL